MQYDVIIAGIRAYNTSKDLADIHNLLKAYTEQGASTLSNTIRTAIYLPLILHLIRLPLAGEG